MVDCESEWMTGGERERQTLRVNRSLYQTCEIVYVHFQERAERCPLRFLWSVLCHFYDALPVHLTSPLCDMALLSAILSVAIERAWPCPTVPQRAHYLQYLKAFWFPFSDLPRNRVGQLQDTSAVERCTFSFSKTVIVLMCILLSTFMEIIPIFIYVSH